MADKIQCWLQLPGPVKMAEDICAVLSGSGTVWISGSFSWAEEVRSFIKEKLCMFDSGVNLEFLDVSAFPEHYSPEELVFLRDPSAEKDYLPAMGLASFVKTKRILPDTILWLYHLDGEGDRKWTDFSKALAKQGAGLKLVCEGAAITEAAKNVRLFSQERCLSEFDHLLYAMLLIQGEKWSTDLKVYVSRLAVFLAGRDAEQIAQLLRLKRELPQEPLRCALGSRPELEEVRALHAIYTAQLMSLLPKVELLRTKLISDTADRLRALVPFCDDYGNQIDRPEDMELRHLVHFEIIGQLSFDWDESSRLHLLYNIRNALSHQNTVDGRDAIACLML